MVNNKQFLFVYNRKTYKSGEIFLRIHKLALIRVSYFCMHFLCPKCSVCVKCRSYTIYATPTIVPSQQGPPVVGFFMCSDEPVVFCHQILHGLSAWMSETGENGTIDNVIYSHVRSKHKGGGIH